MVVIWEVSTTTSMSSSPFLKLALNAVAAATVVPVGGTRYMGEAVELMQLVLLLGMKEPLSGCERAAFGSELMTFNWSKQLAPYEKVEGVLQGEVGMLFTIVTAT